MGLTSPQKHILFLLGNCYEQYKQHLKDKPLDIVLSKTAFVDLAIKANLAGKQERALYKNLEILERSKCVRYENKVLIITDKGKKVFEEIKQDLEPYLSVCFSLNSQNVTTFTNKAKAVLLREDQTTISKI